MRSAGIPKDDSARLRALHGLSVLDTLPEAFSDAISTAAAAISGVPISAISLVDEKRQWFKASCGLPLQSTGREVSFCAHAILETEPLLVEDALTDPRFWDNPLVTGAPYIRAYAGFPLVIQGHAVGALCVIDDRPRRFSPDVVYQLQRLAEGTVEWLVERQRIHGSFERVQEQLRLVTFSDSATGLPSRLVLQDRLIQASARSERTGQTLALLYLHFGPNARLGRRALNQLESGALRELTSRLVGLCRATDTVARVGDGDFVILAEGWGNLQATERLAQGVHASLVRPVKSGAREIFLEAAIGVTFFPSHGPADRLVSYAAMACGEAKPRIGFACFSQAIADAERHRAELLDSLRYAQSRCELAVHYQPKVESKSFAVTGVEALLRWRHPTMGSISPADFIPLAEESGLIETIGSWVIEETIRQVSLWQESGLLMNVSINLSPMQLHQPTLVDQIQLLLARERIDAALITFEITESLAMDEAIVAGGVLERLRNCGVRISIDDFGTGYSSLAYLRRLPVQQLKIDRSFIADLDAAAEAGAGSDARTIVKTIIDLGHALRLEVVAEGVETEAQRRELVLLGCDKLQGFLFARPMPAHAVNNWLQDWKGLRIGLESCRDGTLGKVGCSTCSER